MTKTELQALEDLLRARKNLLEKETDPMKQEVLRSWVKETEAQIEQHKFARKRD